MLNNIKYGLDKQCISIFDDYCYEYNNSRDSIIIAWKKDYLTGVQEISNKFYVVDSLMEWLTEMRFQFKVYFTNNLWC